MIAKLPEKCFEESQEYFLSQSQITQSLQSQKQSLHRLNEDLEKCYYN